MGCFPWYFFFQKSPGTWDAGSPHDVYMFRCRLCQGRSTPMKFPYYRGWETQPNGRGLIYPLSGFPIEGWMSIPNTRSLDPGSFHETSLT